MNGAFKRAVVGGGVLLLAVSSTQCAYYYDLTGRDIVLRKPSEAPKAPLAAGTAPPEEGMEERYERGLSSLERGEYEEAAADFLTVFSQDPSYREVEKKLIQAQRLIRKVPVEREILEAAEYTIGLGDILDVSVWQWPDLTMPSVIVRPDGKISFPLVGDVQAEGLTLTALDAVLTGRLEEFIKAPEVSVSIAQFGGRKVIVLGEVGSQGVYAPTGKTSVLEVVALAGGVSPLRGHRKRHPDPTRTRADDPLSAQPQECVEARQFAGQYRSRLERHPLCSEAVYHKSDRFRGADRAHCRNHPLHQRRLKGL